MKRSRARAVLPNEILAAEKVEKSLESEPFRMTDKLKKLVIMTIANLGRVNFQELCKRAGYNVGPNSKMSVIKKKVDTIIGERLAEVDIFEIDIAATLKECLQAMKTIGSKGEFLEVPDYPLRLKAAVEILKMGEAKYYQKGTIKVAGNFQHQHTVDAPSQTVAILKRRRAELEEVLNADDYEVVEDERAA